MGFELGMFVVMEALDRRFLDGAVHPLDLTVCPRMLHLRQTMLDAIFPASHVEHMGHVSRCRPVGVSGWKRELNAVVGENGMDFVRHCFNECDEEGRS